ncbi:hypothetical protein ENSA5_02610 [Enhygromyxa salina]|uniref:Lipoprotein n=1 Tax=Enhygromyxa salina TaxID=215803 RepID=A0A2S9YK32_9BACT|nr:hypothetical protein [Enhygromyxa salina]PRQ05440.1 hypothetical protein ENSA5_02610 [Enhygromyxa salina]
MGPRLAIAALLVSVLAQLTACVHARDFRAADERMTPHSAYAEHARVRLDLELLGPEPYNFVLNTGVTVAAVPDRLDLSLNLAHAGIGALSFQSKFTLVDSRWFGLGGRVGLTYVNPRTFWFLPRDLREVLGSFNLMSVPVELWTSYPVARWVVFHLGLSYRHAALWGRYEGDELLADSNIAQRSFGFAPYLDLFIAERVAIILGARLPVFMQAVARNDVESELGPGLRVGVRSVEWVDLRFTDAFRAELGAETRFGANTHLRLSVNVGAFRPLGVLLVAPSLNLYWRFK